MTWRLMRGDTVTNVVLFTIALSTATTIWSLRPQVFSIALLPLLTMLAMADRWRLLVPLVALWANLHAGVAMGIAVLSGSVLAALVTDRDRLVQRLVGTVLAVAATLLNPVGFTAWLEMGRSMARSRANQIEEWMMPSAGEHLIFWMVGAAFVWQLATGWRRLRSPGDRVLAMAALVALPVAGGAVRSVPAFMMLMAPALSRLLSQPDESQRRPLARGGGSVVVTTAVGAAVVTAVLIVATAWTHRWSRLGWDPVSPSAARAISSCAEPLYNPYEAGGSIIWFAPAQPVFVDSRQDQYPTSLVQEGTRVEATGDYHRLFDRYRFNCAAVRPESPVARSLELDGWVVAFADRQWVVLNRPR
jgi:hypothetical protein